ncbi:MAG: sulfatase-like hydrolase/transferase, partial [Candidatus Hydrogenedentes bacterium]|nr:sulfatase-like hydrolase/transferase [Candidatus Hydrogenedentota bacterium]
YPYRPPAPYDRMFTKRYTRNVVKEGVLRDVHDRYATSNLPYFSQVHDVTQEDIDFVKGLYDGAIRYTDDKMSELLAVLQYDPAKDLLVYTADHGEQFFEHGFWGHGRHGYPEEINVPLVMRWDGLTPRTINQPVSLLDLYPTFAELCGFAAPEGHDGESLASLLTGGPEKPRAVASESADWRGPVVTLIGPKFLYLLSTRTKSIYPWKVWPDDEELYDLQTDPRCQKNLLGSSTFEIADDMNRLMRGMLPRYGNFHPNNIRGDEETLTWGGNLFTATEENLQSWTYGALAETTRTEDNSVSFTVNAPEMSVAGPTEFFTTLYVVDVKYTLSSGVMELVVESEDGTVLWDYEIRKPAESWQSLRGAFYPRSGTTRLVVRMTEPGSAQLGWPIMRKPEVPFINLAQWEPMDKQPAAARWKPRDKKPAAEEEPAAVVEPEPEPEPDPNTVVFEQIMPPADTAPAPEPEVMENVQPADTPDQVEEGGEADTTEEPELTDEQKMRLEALGYT